MSDAVAEKETAPLYRCTEQRSADTAVQTRDTFCLQRLPEAIERTLIAKWESVRLGLQPHFHRIEWVLDRFAYHTSYRAKCNIFQSLYAIVARFFTSRLQGEIIVSSCQGCYPSFCRVGHRSCSFLKHQTLERQKQMAVLNEIERPCSVID